MEKKLITIERDDLLVEVLKAHKGRDNALSSRDIARMLSDNGFPTLSESVHGIVATVMFERHLPICSLSRKGYYWGITEEDITMAIEDLMGKADSLVARAKHLEGFIPSKFEERSSVEIKVSEYENKSFKRNLIFSVACALPIIVIATLALIFR